MRAVVSGGLSQPFDQAAALSTLVGNVANAVKTVEVSERPNASPSSRSRSPRKEAPHEQPTTALRPPGARSKPSSENGVGQHDIVAEVSFTFGARVTY
jgi:hypothetical protein